MRAGNPSLLAPTFASKIRAAERSAVEAGEATGATGATGPRLEWDHADAVLVLVHGMGNAHRSQILLEWAEPLLARLDWMARDRTLRNADDDALDYAVLTSKMEKDRIGVTLHNVDLTGDQPIITATVCYPDGAGTACRRIAMLEARWSESFAPMTRSEVFHWAVRFLWRAIRRIIRLFWFTMVMSTFASFWKRREPTRQDSSSPAAPWVMRITRWLLRLAPWTVRVARWVARAARAAWRIILRGVDAIRLVAAVGLTVVSTAVVLAFGAVVSVILPLLTPLLLIPAVQRVAQSAIDIVVESIGDVATWKERPSRATAMRLVIRSTLGTAKELATSKGGDADGVVHLLAHSQGAALAAYALLEEEWPDIRVDHLHTVGAAVTLLGRDRWRGRPDVYTPVAHWKPKRDAMTWTNYTATWDPFAAGPIADTDADARRRWRAAYGARTSEAPGPEERLVHNSSQPFTDHGVYHRNLVQVVDPIARSLVPGLRPPTEPAALVSNTLSVMTRRALGIGLACAVIIGVLLPTIPAVSAALAWGVQWTTALWGDLTRFLTPGVEPDDASASTGGFLITAGADAQYDPVLSGAGWLVASLLIAAALAWFVQLLAKWCEQTRDWRRCPARPLPWLLVTSLPRLLFVGIAMLTIGLATQDLWAKSSPPIPFLVVMALAGVGLLLFIEPWRGIVPSVVPPRKERGEPVAAREATTAFDGLLAAAGSPLFTDEWKRRRALRRSEPPGPIRALLRRLGDWIAGLGRREPPRHA